MSQDVFKAPKARRRQNSRSKSESEPWGPVKRGRRSKEDFVNFCNIVLEYAQYESIKQEDLRASNNTSPLDSIGSTAESFTSDSTTSSTFSETEQDDRATEPSSPRSSDSVVPRIENYMLPKHFSPKHNGYTSPPHGGYSSPPHEPYHGYSSPRQQGPMSPRHQGYTSPSHNGEVSPKHVGYTSPKQQAYTSPHQGYTPAKYQSSQSPQSHPADHDDGSEDENELITCFCMKPFAGRPMIECSTCLTWIHLSCAKIRKSNIPDKFECQNCKESKFTTRKSSRQRRESKMISA